MRPLSHSRRALPILALVALPAVLGAGCGREEEPDLVNGKAKFAAKCGSCHVLGRVPTAKGTQGPNLDEAFAAARRSGMNDETIEGVVYRQIANVRRGSAMPANLVTGEDRRDVAAYVGRSASRRGGDQGELAEAGKPKVSDRPVRAEGGKLQMDADPTGALAFTSTAAIAPPGPLELVMKNPASIQHNIAVEGGGVNEKGPVVGQGGTSRVSVDVKKGKYTYLCTVPGHAAGGMKGTLTVE